MVLTPMMIVSASTFGLAVGALVAAALLHGRPEGRNLVGPLLRVAAGFLAISAMVDLGRGFETTLNYTLLAVGVAGLLPAPKSVLRLIVPRVRAA